MQIHESITVDRVADAVTRRLTTLDNNPGFCTVCGADAEGVEPEARKRKCAHCGKKAVFGADELLLMLVP
jgi:hypothetical protein